MSRDQALSVFGLGAGADDAAVAAAYKKLSQPLKRKLVAATTVTQKDTYRAELKQLVLARDAILGPRPKRPRKRLALDWQGLWARLEPMDVEIVGRDGALMALDLAANATTTQIQEAYELRYSALTRALGQSRDADVMSSLREARTKLRQLRAILLGEPEPLFEDGDDTVEPESIVSEAQPPSVVEFAELEPEPEPELEPELEPEPESEPEPVMATEPDTDDAPAFGIPETFLDTDEAEEEARKARELDFELALDATSRTPPPAGEPEFAPFEDDPDSGDETLTEGFTVQAEDVVAMIEDDRVAETGAPTATDQYLIEQQEWARREQERREQQRREEEARLAEEREREEREEQERLAAEREREERMERERQEQIERERLERLEREREEQERRAEAERRRLERERLEREQAEAERVRMEQERLERERLEAERVEEERRARQRAEAARLDRIREDSGIRKGDDSGVFELDDFDFENEDEEDLDDFSDLEESRDPVLEASDPGETVGISALQALGLPPGSDRRRITQAYRERIRSLRAEMLRAQTNEAQRAHLMAIRALRMHRDAALRSAAPAQPPTEDDLLDMDTTEFDRLTGLS